MSAVLYIIATPIGNLHDITFRAVNTLTDVDLVAAEDTRHSQRLLNHLGLEKKMISLHEHNEHQRIQKILDFMQQGLNIGLISDAGTPLISDPGYPLLRAVIDAGYRVEPIPGVSSVITALCASGLPTDQFCFHGFPGRKKSQCMQILQQVKKRPGTHIFFESTHRIEKFLQQIEQTLPQVAVVVAKELTKKHETFIRGSAAQCLKEFARDKNLTRGEFVVLIYHAETESVGDMKIEPDELLERLMQDMPLKKAVKLAVELTGLKKNELYQLALRIAR